MLDDREITISTSHLILSGRVATGPAYEIQVFHLKFIGSFNICCELKLYCPG